MTGDGSLSRFKPSEAEDKRRVKAGMELFELLAEADDDVKNNRVAPVEDTFSDLRNLLKG